MYIPELNLRTKKIIGISSVFAALLLIAGLSSYTGLLSKLTDIFGSRAASAPITLDTKNDFLGVSLTPEALNFYKASFVTVDDIPQDYLLPEDGTTQDGYITVDASLFGNFTPSTIDGHCAMGFKCIPSGENTSGGGEAPMPAMEYFSPALTLEGSSNNLSGFSVLDYSASGRFDIHYSYRQADSLVGLENAEFQSLDMGAGTQVTGSELVAKDITFNSIVGKYLQIKVAFTKATTDATGNYGPAVYQMQVHSESLDAASPGPNEKPLNTDLVTRKLTVHYGTVNAPKDAEVKLYAADASGQTIASRSQEDLSQRASLTLEDLALTDGAQYMLSVKSPEILEKLVQFTVSKDVNLYEFNLGTFSQMPTAASADTKEKRIVDVNGDGKINLADLSLFMQLYGDQAEGGLPRQQ
jgi:hypothetical protein